MSSGTCRKIYSMLNAASAIIANRFERARLDIVFIHEPYRVKDHIIKTLPPRVLTY